MATDEEYEFSQTEATIRWLEAKTKLGARVEIVSTANDPEGLRLLPDPEDNDAS